MNKTTIELITGFLETNFDDFAAYLDDNDIEPSEGGVIIEDLKDVIID